MEIKDLSNQELIQERDSIRETIATLRKKRSGLDNEIEHYYYRKNEIEEEIVKRFKGE